MMGKGCCVEAVSGELAAGDVVGVQCSTAVVAEDGVVVDPAAEDGGGDGDQHARPCKHYSADETW